MSMDPKTRKKLFHRLKAMSPARLDQQVMEMHEKVFACTDCLQCANCCKTTGPLFTDRDIGRISKHLKLKPGGFVEKYLRIDEDGDYVLKQVPCAFLLPDNRCSIYDVRPKACREYPHTDRTGQHKILHLTRINATICPAVAGIVERLWKID